MEELKSIAMLAVLAWGIQPFTMLVAELRTFYLTVFVTWSRDPRKLAVAISLLETPPTALHAQLRETFHDG